MAVPMVVTISYFSLDSAGGSGYLGAFLAGLIVGNMERLGLAMEAEYRTEDAPLRLQHRADLATFFVFIVLGANIPFGVLGDNLLPALAVVGALLLLARPLTVFACTLPDRRGAWTREELTFLLLDPRDGRRPSGTGGGAGGLGVPETDTPRRSSPWR